MNKTSKNETGFSAVEVILVLVVIVLIGGAGWLVYKNHSKAKPAASASTSSTGTGAYKGWKSFCSSYGGLCLDYPPAWTLETKTIPSQTDSSVKTQQADITSPSG